jgi:hypothetical protein
MEFQIPLPIPTLQEPICIGQGIFLIGSCFTEHIGDRLKEMKFNIHQNPHGILFDPQSVANSLLAYVNQREYGDSDLFFLNEVWQSWDHHSRFSSTEKNTCLNCINDAQKAAHGFLQKADWLVITLGSSYSYKLTENGRPVANCHRAPAQFFQKHLMGIEETFHAIRNALEAVKAFNPSIKVILTISPVRHIRDGAIANNRSKARLIEAVHQLVEGGEWIHYFPAYELVMDVLRDYRFFDIDMVHPNYAATRYVMERFVEACMNPLEKEALAEIQQLVIARKHRPSHPETNAHRKFMQAQVEKMRAVLMKYPGLDFSEEWNYFNVKAD